MKKIFLFIMLLLVMQAHHLSAGNETGKMTISGQVKDASNGETLMGASVYISELRAGSITNTYGFYSLSVAPGKYTLVYSYVGYTGITQTIDLSKNVTLNMELKPESKELQEVVVKGEKANANVIRPEMSVQKLQMITIKKIPALMGEVDVIKAIQMLPGVLPASEGTSSFSVRGGGIDQNLIILDEATVYNASHMMGFFSVFNNDAISDVKLYKGDIPAYFGGRLSSVLDVKMKEGNSKKFSASGGIGIISSRHTLEGPLVNENTSFLISGRRTYADLFFPLSNDENIKKTKLYFYDLNLKLNHRFNDNNRLFLSAYMGRDNFGEGSLYGMAFGNQTFTLRWNHLFSKQLFSNVSLIYSHYDYALNMNFGGDKYYWNSYLKDIAAKADFNYFVSPEFNLKFGAASTYHTFDPCNAWIIHKDSTDRLHLPLNYALEHVLYISAEQQFGEKFILKYGLRYSIFQNIGSAKFYNYDQNYNHTDMVLYGKNKIFNTWSGIEPRLGVTYTINEKSSMKASYSHTVQYVQLASNSTGGMPLDIWFPASPNIKPQKADQYGIGYFRNFNDNMFEFSAETYFKKMKDVIDFKDHAQLLMNPFLEGEVRTGSSDAYGVEFLLRKNEGKLNGWLSYTLSKVTRKIAQINDGKAYPSPYDKPNSINIIMNYELSKRLMVSANWIYSTGTPFSSPDGKFQYGNSWNKIYSPRNGNRFPDYHRLDVSVTLKNKLKPGRLWHGEWVFSMYNAYGRHNAWIINFVQDKQIGYAEQTYLFTFFPAITYNFNF
jgi:hypothetical protein